MNKKTVLGIVGIIITVFLLWYFFSQYDISKTWTIISQTSLGIIILMSCVYLSAFIFRTFRWQLMFPAQKKDFFHFFKSIVLGYAGNNVLPARGGELVRMEYFSKKTAIPRITSLSSIGVEKIIDATILLFFFAASLALVNLKADDVYIYRSFIVVLSVLLPVLMFLVLLYFHGMRIINYLNQKHNFLYKFAPIVQKIYDSIVFLETRNNTLKIIFLSILIWLIEALVFIIAIYSIIGVGFMSASIIGLLALSLVNFAIIIPSSPGYIGVFQMAIVIALSAFDISEQYSFATSVVIHACQFFPTLLIGGILVLYKKK
ncbi:MAG: lysylphosphatidylglycerol synthase transmembrane domain-containing protein [Bacteroidales bacterium]|jgi:uncharacterized protein (TIRG00374 family)|nr:lysylphosphatidylglycerol synthase transmembrane domain-containing protein [Bacteroidales bacterium]